MEKLKEALCGEPLFKVGMRVRVIEKYPEGHRPVGFLQVMKEEYGGKFYKIKALDTCSYTSDGYTYILDGTLELCWTVDMFDAVEICGTIIPIDRYIMMKTSICRRQALSLSDELASEIAKVYRPVPLSYRSLDDLINERRAHLKEVGMWPAGTIASSKEEGVKIGIKPKSIKFNFNF